MRDYFAAARANDLETLRRLLDEQPLLVSQRIPGDNRLLGVVWEKGKSHQSLAPSDTRSCTALHHAAANAKAEMVRLLLDRGADPNAIAFDNNAGNATALHLAATQGDAATVKILLDHGADPNIASEKGITPIEAAAGESIDREQKRQLLIAHGAVVTLHCAARYGMIERVRELLASDNRFVDTPDRAGTTPLDYSIESGQRDLADLLLRSGAKLTPQAAAAFGMMNELREFVDADPKIATNGNLLTRAAMNGQVDAIEFLLARGADPNETDYDAAAPLHNVAMSWVRPTCAASVAPLIAAGAKTELIHRGYTPLTRAIHTENIAVARALLENGADPAMPNSAGKTPLQLAIQFAQQDLAENIQENINHRLQK